MSMKKDPKTIAVEAVPVTVEMIDSQAAELDVNVRTAPVLPVEFVDSIRAEGVREPVLARRGEDGTVYVYDGQRRLLAAREAELAAIPAVFGLAGQTGTAAERIMDQLRTFAREDLTLTDRVPAYQRLALDGIAVETIARSTGATARHVKDSITAANSPTATKVMQEYGEQMTLDRLVAITEFEGDEDAAERIAGCDDDELAFTVQEIRDEKALDAAEKELVKQFEADGYTVTTENPRGSYSYLDSLTDAGDDAEKRPALTTETHMACPGRTIYLEVWGTAENDNRAYEMCTQPELHHQRFRPHSPVVQAPADESDEEREAREVAEQEAKRTERARVIQNNKAWRTATTVRREWVTTFLARKTLPKDVAAFVATSLTKYPTTITDYNASEMLAPFSDWNPDGTRGPAQRESWTQRLPRPDTSPLLSHWPPASTTPTTSHPGAAITAS
ncbi:ParB N-terminal domain-containing protein [Planctomonas sp. JC2975]|uniref:ParB N-terminal domain-containing protein n=1 Tax=Planctomonas sp. JC2975 TaxID=2729626 RepID=UPI001473E7C1|nr:ParB N-terminal domain-containing protein [Planctomonas sp. JC2975]NNC14066.1 ParB N-terminal domain-containing protein [Planctomonas sp. JC2975]